MFNNYKEYGQKLLLICARILYGDYIGCNSKGLWSCSITINWYKNDKK